jgi:hypothetical protein
LACSGRYQERRPLPDPRSWYAIADPERRLRRGLSDLYGYYQRNGNVLAPILRDADSHRLTRELMELRLGQQFERIRTVLAEPFRTRGAQQRRLLAVLNVFLNFNTWRTCTGALSQNELIEAAVRALRCQ